ncbi:MAG: alkaline phosphatase [Chloroflexi bacterium]|nr:alkaline phosphatase [Chloroflexota bacterium]
MNDKSWWRDILRQPLSRRAAIKAGSVTVATVVISAAAEAHHDVAAAGSAVSKTPAGTNGHGLTAALDPSRLVARDAHEFIELMSRRQEALEIRSLQQSGTPRLRIMPNHRAKFLLGQRFDLRVEAENIDPGATEIVISVDNGGETQIPLNASVKTNTKPTSAELTWRGLAFSRAGRYRFQARATAGGQAVAEATVTWDVVAADTSGTKAKNIILFIGDGMGQGAITAARIVSKGIAEGKYNGLLEMDMMDVYGHVSTSGIESIGTDSANSAHAYATGHKGEQNAMGVYPDNTPDDDFDNPRVENIVELVKRSRGMSVGLITTADVTDATPAAFFSHTRRRARYRAIAEQALQPERFVDVFMGGGYDKFLPASDPGSNTETKDERNLLDEARAQGVTVVTTRAEMKAAGRTQKLWGLFRPGNMNVYLDREVLRDQGALNANTGLNPKALVGGPWMDQPTLWEMLEKSIEVLEQNPNGFFLMVEGASIDKQEHPMDWQRAVWDLIEMDKAVGMAKQWAASRNDTLIAVTADHNHSMQVVGTYDRDKGVGRAGTGVYGDAGFPNFVDSNGDGFPDDPNPSRTLFVGFSNHPDYRDDFQIDVPGPTEPAVLDMETRKAVPNPRHDPDAELQTGNLPFDQTNCVHIVDDVIIVASGPGAQRFRGLLDNTEVFYAMVDALGLEVPARTAAVPTGQRTLAAVTPR